MKTLLTLWRVVTDSPSLMVMATLLVVGIIVLGLLVMVHRYRLVFQWKSGRFELTPGPKDGE